MLYANADIARVSGWGRVPGSAFSYAGFPLGVPL